jgi:hypothetical protein
MVSSGIWCHEGVGWNALKQGVLYPASHNRAAKLSFDSGHESAHLLRHTTGSLTVCRFRSVKLKNSTVYLAVSVRPSAVSYRTVKMILIITHSTVFLYSTDITGSIKMLQLTLHTSLCASWSKNCLEQWGYRQMDGDWHAADTNTGHLSIKVSTHPPTQLHSRKSFFTRHYFPS